MTTLEIGRLSATAHVVSGEPEVRRTFDRVLAAMVERALGDQLDRAGLPPGEWYLNRLDVRVHLDALQDDPATARAWAEQLMAALREALASGAALHFPGPADALADLIAECALDRFEHAWAWRQAGLVARDVQTAPLDAVLAALAARPELALAAVTAAVRMASVPAVHRLFGAPGWVALARTVLAANAASPSLPAVEGAPAAHAARHDTKAAAVVAGRAGAVVASSVLARRLTRSRLRPDQQTAVAWAVLCVADADPAVLPRAIAPAVITQVAAALTAPATTASARPTAAEAPDAPASVVPGASAGPHTAPPPPLPPPEPAEADAPTAGKPQPATARRGQSPEPGEAGAPTAWGGLLFLIATADDADIPGELFDDELAARPLAWVLHAIALDVVPATAGDPAALAFAGLPPSAEPPSLAWRAATDAERGRIAGHARRWVTVTAARLDPDGRDDPAAVVRRIARRPGRVIAERSWIDVELSLDEVDVDVRRAGLDVDPGWVGWLGSVVRFRYV
jgi:hypothetical protein